VIRAFRNLAIVSLQFRPLLTTWTFTVVVPADKISVTTLPVVTRRRAGSARAELLFLRQTVNRNRKPGRATAAVALDVSCVAQPNKSPLSQAPICRRYS